LSGVLYRRREGEWIKRANLRLKHIFHLVFTNIKKDKTTPSPILSICSNPFRTAPTDIHLRTPLLSFTD